MWLPGGPGQLCPLLGPALPPPRRRGRAQERARALAPEQRCQGTLHGVPWHMWALPAWGLRTRWRLRGTPPDHRGEGLCREPSAGPQGRAHLRLSLQGGAPQLLFMRSLTSGCFLHPPASLEMPVTQARGRGLPGAFLLLPVPPGTTPSPGRTPLPFSPYLSLSRRQSTGCAVGPTRNVCPQQPRSPRRKLSRWARGGGTGVSCGVLGHPGLPEGGDRLQPGHLHGPPASPPPAPILVPRLDREGPHGWETPGRASRGPCASTPLRASWAQAQKESYRQEKKRATKQLLSALTDPSVVIMADSLKVSRTPRLRREGSPGARKATSRSGVS